MDGSRLQGLRGHPAPFSCTEGLVVRAGYLDAFGGGFLVLEAGNPSSLPCFVRGAVGGHAPGAGLPAGIAALERR
jgi:hypothetical protein